ncbi:hypothetical protein [Dactylosporangium sp. CA-139066]|uniref:hypothetical protein n=1 Tax=Dactylosporangium sp. CA-139066 TaxID=3239930 RepID=UPI003D8A353E
MVVRLVRAGVGALLLLIAVPLALAGGGLLLAMEHRAADDTFTARLERVRADGIAVVVPDVDALLRADAPFARGGQTTLSLSAVGAGGPLFIGLGEERDVQRYLEGAAQSRLTRVRLARGPLPVELTTATARREHPMVLPPAPPVPGVPAPGVPAPGDPALGDPAPGDPAAVPAPADGQVPADAQPADGPGAPATAKPGEQKFWLARSERHAGAAELTWSPSALRGRHLSLVIMRADAAPGVDAALTARLDPAWLGPTTGGLLMLGSALFFLALVTIAWPQGRRPAPLAVPVLPTQPMPELPAAPAPAPAADAEPAAKPEPVVEAREENVAEEANAPAEPEPAEAQQADEPATAEGKRPSRAVLATLADVLAAADAEAAEQRGQAEQRPAEVRDVVLLTESELDRPAPEGVELEGNGPIQLPPLPAMPAIELQFTWAPLALDEPADSGRAAR